MRASIFVAIVSLAASTMAADYSTYPVPTTTGISTPSGMPVPHPNGTTNGTRTPTPSADAAGSVFAPGTMVGLAVAGVAVAVGGAVF